MPQGYMVKSKTLYMLLIYVYIEKVKKKVQINTHIHCPVQFTITTVVFQMELSWQSYWVYSV